MRQEIRELVQVVNTLSIADARIQRSLFDFNETETEELHYLLLDCIDRLECEIDHLKEQETA